MESNPVLARSDLPYAAPRFDLIREEHFLPAFAAAILFKNLLAVSATPGLLALATRVARELARHADSVALDRGLYARVREAADSADADPGLSSEDRMLARRVREDFESAGAQLSDADVRRVAELNESLAVLRAQFAENVLAGTRAASELAGVALANTTPQPVLETTADREARRRVHAASVGRCREGSADNRPVVTAIAALRSQRAALLGHPCHASWVLQSQSAGSPAEVAGLLAKLAGPAIANARSEQAELEAILGGPLEASDWQYLAAERARRAAAGGSGSGGGAPEDARAYLELWRVLHDGVFFAASRLFGVEFRRRADLPVYHEDVRAYEVVEGGGRGLALVYVDAYAREGKRGGAWMRSYASRSRRSGARPVVAVHINAERAEPALLTWDMVTTLFHEFGHALHGVLADVEYERLGNIDALPMDFAEFPSQLNEMWASDPEVMRSYARHHATGEPMPEHLAQHLLRSDDFNKGFVLCQYLQAAYIDQAWYSIGAGDPQPTPETFDAFEASALRRAGFGALPAVPPRYHSAYFMHSFAASSEDYAACYYCYVFAEILDADCAEHMRASGGLARAVGDALRARVLAPCGSAPGLDLFRAFVGREPDIAPLLRRRGLVVS
eukprot:m51a1_g11112 putative Mitochondrial intermediate peptidase (621) ;mRNA; r:80709-83104